MKDILLHTKHEKLSEKVFIQNIAVSVISILICAVALCSMTWAWFNASTSNSSNSIQTGTFALSASVEKEENNSQASAQDPNTPQPAAETGESSALSISPTTSTKQSGKTVYELPASGTYTITLIPTQESTVSRGYCVVTVYSSVTQSSVSYTTGSISRNTPFTFTLSTNEIYMEVSFEAVWGTPATPEITENENIVSGGVETQQTQNDQQADKAQQTQGDQQSFATETTQQPAETTTQQPAETTTQPAS